MKSILAAVAASLFAAHIAFAQPVASDDPIIGIWWAERVFGNALKGELTITRESTIWRATIANGTVQTPVSGDAFRVVFANKGGEFRGTLSDRGRTIRGYWLQERADPSGSGQAYATPLVLTRSKGDVWRGIVNPLEGRLTLYLKVYRNAEGALVGAFRNPEVNLNGGASLFGVTRVGDKVHFGIKPAPEDEEIAVGATLLRKPDRLRVDWPNLGPIDLVRRTPQEAGAFFPRPPGEPPYAYRRPETTDDGWTTARPKDVGMDEAALARLVQRLIDLDPAARRAPLTHSLLVARRGKLVLDEYFFGHDRDTPHDTRSAGKTFASVMLGAAMMKGDKIAPETKIYDQLSSLGPFANPDPRKAEITLAHLMTHSAGLACNDNDSGSPGNEGTMQSQEREPNWWKHTLDLPMAHDPGRRYAYCSANINLVGGALTAATQTWLPELFARTIARPLQFGRHHWNLIPTGEGYLGGGAFLRPRDLLKVGQVYLDGGVWKGRRIVDKAWVERSTAQHIEISPATTGLTPEDFGNFYTTGADGYTRDGYAWHIVGVRSGDRAYAEYDASGNGGQLLIVIPSLELVVVLTGGNYGQGGIWNRWRDDIVGAEIIPAIMR